MLFLLNRVPTARLVLELPAGMLDDDKGDFVGTAVREVEEETGIHLNLEDMVDLTAFLDPTTGCRVIPSPVLTNFEKKLSVTYISCLPSMFREDVMKKLAFSFIEDVLIKMSSHNYNGKESGLHDRGELIKVRVVPCNTLAHDRRC
ncbi:hypothetical protein GH714_009689 [Hevea brasiliensis]|uniref:Nudix hydrolase domain-containing protein n=1 Tax=Hevea brasiliensis TaxID=3981 RepID=A0A6A6MJP0_HEVBR|nr:hypothetical protein GH714_009689 [Hevea brasiliensis]